MLQPGQLLHRRPHRLQSRRRRSSCCSGGTTGVGRPLEQGSTAMPRRHCKPRSKAQGARNSALTCTRSMTSLLTPPPRCCPYCAAPPLPACVVRQGGKLGCQSQAGMQCGDPTALCLGAVPACGQHRASTACQESHREPPTWVPATRAAISGGRLRSAARAGMGRVSRFSTSCKGKGVVNRWCQWGSSHGSRLLMPLQRVCLPEQCQHSTLARPPARAPAAAAVYLPDVYQPKAIRINVPSCLTCSSCGSSYQMVCPPCSLVRVFLASGASQGLMPFTVQYQT